MTEKKKVVVITPSKKADKKSNKKKESKSETFLRLAESRTISVLYRIRILGNCSNRTNYEYSSEQIESMKVSIQKALDNMFSKFTPSKVEQEAFKF